MLAHDATTIEMSTLIFLSPNSNIRPLNYAVCVYTGCVCGASLVCHISSDTDPSAAKTQDFLSLWMCLYEAHCVIRTHIQSNPRVSLFFNISTRYAREKKSPDSQDLHHYLAKNLHKVWVRIRGELVVCNLLSFFTQCSKAPPSFEVFWHHCAQLYITSSREDWCHNSVNVSSKQVCVCVREKPRRKDKELASEAGNHRGFKNFTVPVQQFGSFSVHFLSLDDFAILQLICRTSLARATYSVWFRLICIQSDIVFHVTLSPPRSTCKHRHM